METDLKLLVSDYKEQDEEEKHLAVFNCPKRYFKNHTILYFYKEQFTLMARAPMSVMQLLF